ncbi:MAG: hypothetical protein NWQ54_20450 [Paraglaciecola sp.]|nr:hypothetical protein [Paraglaciecola sp.]
MATILIIVFLLLIVAAELIFRLRMKIGAIPVSVLVLVLVTLLGAYGYFFESSAYEIVRPPIKYALSNIIMFGSPIILMLVATSLFKTPSSLFIHWFAGVFSALYTAFFPLIAIYTVCTLGIDCL